MTGLFPVFVLDASVTIAALLPEDRSDEARSILRRALSGVIVPALWHLEVGNILIRAERRGAIKPRGRETLLADLAIIPIDTDHEGSIHAWRGTTDLALRHSLTLYDATYLELAIRYRLPLATFDASLVRAATAEHLPPLG